MTNFKELHKKSRESNGKIHPKTLYYLFRRYPLLLPFIVIYAAAELIKSLANDAIKYCRAKRYDSKFANFATKNSDNTISEFIKPIALYLPQFHEIPENNEWWGKGFTEWTNVKKAKPLFDGHYQPHIPHEDVGYYDLSDVAVMAKQADMAKKYGIYGFCFYYYHFKDGKRLLEKPINNYLANKDINFPFCFAWANENWTRVWDGGEKNIIMPQDYSEANMLNMFKDMLIAFKDERYIKHDGKPVLLIYRAEIIPEIRALTNKWRNIIKEHGFDGIYLISMQNFKQEDPYSMGFDAATEFAPKYFDANKNFKENNIKAYDENWNLNLVNYSSVLKTMCNSKEPRYTRYKSVCPAWDNSARRGPNGPLILYNTSKEYFYELYKTAVKNTLVTKAKDAGFIFINAWNEWAEGTHLEPDEKHGYDNLDVIKSIQDARCIDLVKK